MHFGAPGGNRTPDPQLRRLLLYPTELLAQAVAEFNQETSLIQSGRPGSSRTLHPTFRTRHYSHDNGAMPPNQSGALGDPPVGHEVAEPPTTDPAVTLSVACGHTVGELDNAPGSK